MKKQIFLIHGGDAWDTREEYLSHLHSAKVSLEWLLAKDWKETLQAQLGDDIAVYRPVMPNKQYARYEEWKIWFERYVPLMDDGVILVGHSLGAIFLAIYLSCERMPKKVSGVFLVGTPFNQGAEQLADFVLPDSLSLLQEQSPRLVFFHSADDHVVPIEHMEQYRRVLPDATYVALDGRGHFKDPQFPELVSEIREIVGSV